MKWINSSARTDATFSTLNYIDERGAIHGAIDIDHETKKVKWYVGTSSGPARSVAHAKKVVEKSVAS